MISFENYYVYRNQKAIIRGFSFSFNKGKFYTLVGRSGSGKTTLMSVPFMNAEMKKRRNITTGGRVSWSGRVVLIPQSTYLAFNPYVKLSKQSKNLITNFSFDLYNKFSIRRDVLCQYPHQISDGTLIKIIFAWCYAIGPSIVVADEITSHLDPIARAKIIHELRRLVDENGTTVIFITHDILQTLQISHEIIVLDNGTIAEVVEQGNPFKSKVGVDLYACAQWVS